MPQQPSSAAACDHHASTGRHLPGAVSDAALTLLDQRAVGIIWLDPELRVLSLAGIAPDGIIVGAHITDGLIPLIGLDEDMLALKSETAPQPLRLSNTTVMAGDGSHTGRFNIIVFWVADRQRFLVLLSTIFMHASPTVELDQEIRRRRLIEQDLAARSQEYARINQQLEEFAYVISHDLNAPLRALRYLSNDIQTALANTVGPFDRDAVCRAAADLDTQTRRMSKMLIDLLEYARVDKVKGALAPVCTRTMIADIVASLRPTTKLELVIEGDWPDFETAAAPLDLVLRNLAENAVKHHDRLKGVVRFGAKVHVRYIAFTITDDGRGIPPDWQAAIFEPFRKIDDAHHPESSGIGLALVKKTVVHLGGSIEVNSGAPQTRGTTFTVHWPLKLAGTVE